MAKPGWKEIVEQVNGKKAKRENDTIFYHYTSVKSFLGIMNGQEFWLSNIHFMNDEQEFYDGQNLCIQVLEEMMGKAIQGQSEENLMQREYFERLHEVLTKSDAKVWHKLRSRDIYGMSFCREGNLLSQWQTYAENGIAIGFSGPVQNPFSGISFYPSKLLERQIFSAADFNRCQKAEIPFQVTNVIYERQKKRQILRQVLQTGEEFLKGAPEHKEAVMESVVGALFYYFTYMKNHAFSQEKECRFIYSFSGSEQKKWPDLVDFREQNGIILPYIRLKMLGQTIGKSIKLPIKEIVVAPGENRQYVAASIRYYLEHSGYSYLADKVTISDIPYRGK